MTTKLTRKTILLDVSIDVVVFLFVNKIEFEKWNTKQKRNFF